MSGARVPGRPAPCLNLSRKPNRRMAEDDADRFRRQAQECVEQAERSISPLDKETWLRVAAEWMRLARSLDDRDGKRRE
jgi:hypothetical protein